MKLVSAIITTHNRPKLLERAIMSVLNQTYTEIECIVVDDASSDDTKTICNSYPIRYIRIPQDKSRGGNHARNIGIKASNGVYCAFLDDDDYWLPEKVKKQVDSIESNECEMVTCFRDYEYILQDGSKKIVHTDGFPTINGDMSKKILYQIYTTTSLMFVKKQALLEVGLFDENLKFWQEYELTIRLAQRAPFYCIDESLAVYRIDVSDKNRLTNKYEEWKEAVRYVRDKHRVLYQKLNILERHYVTMQYLIEASGRSLAVGKNWESRLYKLLLNTIFIPGRLILAYGKFIERYK